MPDVKNLNFAPALDNAINHAIHMRLAPINKVSKVLVLGSHWGPQGIGLQGKYRPRVFPVYRVVERDEIALSTWHNPNRVSHAWP